MITFIAKYPNSENIKDGMIQRINSIDELFHNRERNYIDISLFRNFKGKLYTDNNARIYQLNYLRHYKKVKNLINDSEVVYIHSILNYIRVARQISKNKNSKIIIDYHGVVPEEAEFYGRNLRSKIYNFFEQKICERSDEIIFVTESMKKYTKEKYKGYNFNSKIVPILPKQLKSTLDKNEINTLMKELEISEDDTVFIYSGNCQKYQNVNEVMQFIYENRNNKNYKFIILSGDIEGIKREQLYEKVKSKIILRSVLPEELNKYYNIAHYGFLLRDKHILNKVACPTKIIEYMNSGIIPIVKYEDIGDFKSYGYEYLKIKDINKKLEPKKSKKNIDIINNIYKSLENIEIL